MKVADLLVACLEHEGVRYVFGIPGEEIEDLLFSLEQSSVQFVPTRHEQGAAFMADVWGRLTGKAGVCLATLGPGAANLITGIADAYLDNAPLVAITGQGGLTRLHHDSHQYLDIMNMLKPITKWNTAISSPEVVTEVVRKAFKLAEDEKPGPTHIELSEDLAKGERIAATEIEAGCCVVNTFVQSDPRLPFGGIKDSGYGRELSSYGIKEFVNIKTVVVQ